MSSDTHRVTPARAKKPFAPQIVSANDLLDGDVVYLRADGLWSRILREAAVARTREAADALLVLADQPGAVVGPYLLTVEAVEGCAPAPLHIRERTRDLGPSNRLDLGRQADRALQLCSETPSEAP
ncbi:MAG: DUF2849 domain-containing protein [Pseudomonadota bacterium]